MPAKPLTPQQKEDAKRLRSLFENWQHGRKERGESSSQEAAAEFLPFGQSALSQYLRGTIPLNIEVVAKFSVLLGCSHEDISPALADEIRALSHPSADSDRSGEKNASPTHISPSDEPQRRVHNPALIADMPEKSGAKIGNDDTPRRKLPDSSYSARYAGDNYSAGPDVKPRFYPEISWVQAGMWTEIAENFVLAEDTKRYQCHIDLGEDGFVLRVDGMSMTAPPGVFPTFPPGMLLFVRPHEDAMPGKHVIVRRNGNTATFKKLVVIDGDLYLEALNPDWPNQYMRLQADDVFCGVVMLASFDLT